MPAFRDWLAHSQSDLGRYLAGIQYASEFSDFSKDDVRQLEVMIVKASGKKAAALLPLGLLSKVVYRVNHTLQLSIPQPTLAVHLTPPTCPFAFSDVALSHRSVESWLKVEKAWLRDLRRAKKDTRRKNVPFELLLLSSALHCGILSGDLAIALQVAMLDPAKHLRHSGRTYVDLSLAWQGKPDQEIRRWYPDDGVACLIARLAPPSWNVADLNELAYADLRRVFAGQIYKRLRGELGKRIAEEALLPTSFADFFDRISQFLRSEMPAVMVGYSTQELQARSLLPPSIDSIYGDPAVQTITVNDSDESKSLEEEDPEAYGGDEHDDAEPVWMKQMRECFGSRTDKTLQARFRTLVSPSAVGRRIISFGRVLIEHGSSSGNALKPNSIKCCVLTVGRRLGRLLEERDLPEIDAEVLEDMYVRAIDDAAKDSQQPHRLQATVAWALREFHCFLMRERVAKPLKEADVFRIPRGFPSVDAMIVSIDDVYRALHHLDYEPNPSWSEENRKFAKMEILLGFFAGLRTMEGLGALREHFPGGTSLPFLVLPTEDRGLKTPNAARIIPVAVNMAPFDDLIEDAAKWVESANQDREAGKHRLFESASEDVVIPMVGAALRAVTGNERARYYTLRHSFGSWLFARLLVSDLPVIPDLVPHLPRTSRWLCHSKQFRCDLYGSDLVSNNHAWAVAALMGHSTPKVSFANYCHLNDIVLSEFLRNCTGLESASSRHDRLRLSSCRDPGTASAHLVRRQKSSKSIAPHKLSAPAYVIDPGDEIETSAHDQDAEETSNCTSWPDDQREKERIFALQEVEAQYPNLQSEPLIAHPAATRSWLEQTWGLLYMHALPNRDLGQLVNFLGVELEQARHMLARNEEICWLRSAASGHELHATSSVDPEMLGGRTVRYPQRPDSKAMAIAEQIGTEIKRMVDKPGNTHALILDSWCRNLVPQWTSALFMSHKLENGDWFVPAETRLRVDQFLRFLHDIGLTQAQLSFRGACGEKRALVPTSWYSQWGLVPRATCKIHNYCGKKAEQIAEGQWLSIGPRRACPGEKDAFDRSYRDGFRFVMLLASIRFGASPDPPNPS
ncbi:MAG TPA: hypothetical protein VMA34_19410 [Terracidiphilus sp.]|nr:hypothetical protein [Terracidiphilus sp.]